MRRYFFPIVVLAALAACSKPKEASNPIADSVAAQVKAVDKDEEEIRNLIRNVLGWSSCKAGYELPCFDIKPYNATHDSLIVTGINKAVLAENLEVLKATGYFTQTFISNYELILDSLDSQIKSGLHGKFIQYSDPPQSMWGGSFDPWCGCADNMLQEYVEITVLHRERDMADLEWHYENLPNHSYVRQKDITYRFTAKKENNRWKIDYMEGFDFKRATKIPVN